MSTIITRTRLNEIVIEVSAGRNPAEVTSRTDEQINLTDGTTLLRAEHGGWYYPGWSKAGRHRDRVRPDDYPTPDSILSGYGVHIPANAAVQRGECPTCGLGLAANGTCGECR